MENLISENQRINASNLSLIEQVNNLKSKLNAENCKYRLLTYKKTNVLQSRSSIFAYKKKIKNILQNINIELRKINLQFEEITIKKANNTDESRAFKIKYSSASENSTIDKCLFYKDKLSLADHKYFKLRKGMGFKKNMAPLRQIKKRKSEIKAVIEINELSTGYYIDPIRYMKMYIQKFLKKNVDFNENQIKIKLSCDGTRLSRNVSVVNFVFSIINEKLKAASVIGCYRIGAFKIDTENYDAINEWLPVLWEQIKKFRLINYNISTHDVIDISGQSNRGVQIGEKTYEIEYFFSADYKMMLIVLGQKAANSDNGCIICEQNKKNYHQIGKYFLDYFLLYFLDYFKYLLNLLFNVFR